jgi:hypothetical protein
MAAVRRAPLATVLSAVRYFGAVQRDKPLLNKGDGNKAMVWAERRNHSPVLYQAARLIE